MMPTARPKIGTPPLVARPCAGHALLALAVACLAVAGGCGPGGPIGARLHTDVQRPDPGVVLFICDGMGANVVEQGCREGWLPNIQRRFVAGGAHVEHATTCIPAITYGVIATLLTGTGPGTHTVVGNRWFDPDYAFFRSYATIEDYRDINYDCDGRTIYELIQPAPSVSIQAALTRGVTANIANWAVSGVMWFFHDYTAVDKLTATSLGQVAGWADDHKQWPTLLTCYFPGADSVGHRCGVSSPQYRRAIEHLDYQVGRVCDWLEARGLLSTTYLVLVADHGMVDVAPDGFIDLEHLVRDRWGRNATDRTLQEGPQAWRAAYFDRFDTVIAYQNGRGAFIYFRGPGGWRDRPTHEEVAAILEAPPPEARLWNNPGVELAAYLAADDAALLRSQHGATRILRREGPTGAEYSYEPYPGDVLGYLADPDLAAFVLAGFHPAREWLGATAGQVFPDFVPHIIPLLHVRRAGQVVVFTQPGYSFARERGGHGGIRREELRIPFMIAGPGIAAGRVIDVARAVDLVPTILNLLNIDSSEDEWLEGVSILNAGRSPPLPDKAEP
jgi:hypothetical protein